jgi:hypothetical protein
MFCNLGTTMSQTADAMSSDITCTEVMLTEPFDHVVLVPGAKTIVTTLSMERPGVLLDGKFTLCKAAIDELLYHLSKELKSYMKQVHYIVALACRVHG